MHTPESVSYTRQRWFAVHWCVARPTKENTPPAALDLAPFLKVRTNDTFYSMELQRWTTRWPAKSADCRESQHGSTDRGTVWRPAGRHVQRDRAVADDEQPVQVVGRCPPSWRSSAPTGS